MNMSPQSQLVFVYGSLKRGYNLHYLLEDQLPLCNAVTLPLYRLFDLGSYPGLVEWPEGLEIWGEVYHVSADCLARLDEVEGVAEQLYVRRRISLQTTFDGKEIHAWFWLGSVAGLRDCGTAWP
jgi:gamma-glutamylaminecyclotransferase